MAKLVYPGLSYEIVGILFTVYNNLKFGYQDKVQKFMVTLPFSAVWQLKLPVTLLLA